MIASVSPRTTTTGNPDIRFVADAADDGSSASGADFAGSSHGEVLRLDDNGGHCSGCCPHFGSVSNDLTSAQAPAGSATAPAPALKTPWGEPDLQGIWTDETDTPLQRSAKFANQEFFTEAQRAELNEARSAMLGRDRRAERGTARDVSGAYNSVFLSVKRIGARTSLILDPPNGRIPPLTPEAQKIAAAERNFVKRCCNRPRPARTSRWPVAEASTTRRPRPDARTFLLATTRLA
jgi:hypothetical protein